MRILIANDDGIDAPGIALLRRAAARLWSDIWVVAPERKWTAASHHLSFDRDLVLTRRGVLTNQVVRAKVSPMDALDVAEIDAWLDASDGAASLRPLLGALAAEMKVPV